MRWGRSSLPARGLRRIRIRIRDSLLENIRLRAKSRANQREAERHPQDVVVEDASSAAIRILERVDHWNRW